MKCILEHIDNLDLNDRIACIVLTAHVVLCVGLMITMTILACAPS